VHQRRQQQPLDRPLLDDLEGDDVIRQIADDLYDTFTDQGLSQRARSRYPAA
jgi:hypothetical protein